MDDDDSDLTGGLIKLAFVVGGIIFIFWLVFNVVLPLFAINLALISIISAFIFDKYKKYIFSFSALSAGLLIFDYNYGFFTSILVQNVPFFQSWIKPMLFANLAAGLTSSFFGIRDILDSRMPEPIDNGTFSKRNLIVMGSLALVGSVTVGIQHHVDTRAGLNNFASGSSSVLAQNSNDLEAGPEEGIGASMPIGADKRMSNVCPGAVVFASADDRPEFTLRRGCVQRVKVIKEMSLNFMALDERFDGPLTNYVDIRWVDHYFVALTPKESFPAGVDEVKVATMSESEAAEITAGLK